MLPSALLFDMDGTLTDTESLWLEAEMQILDELGASWDLEATKDIIGMDFRDACTHMISATNLAVTTDELVDMLLTRVVDLGRRHGMPWRPGALELLELSVELGIPSALVTSSYMPFASLALANAPEGTLTAAVTGDQVTHGKPHPEPYLRAAQMLGVPISGCIAFEDSRPGLISAHASGAVAVAIPFQVELPNLDGAYTIGSLEDIDHQMLIRFAQRA